MTTALLLYYVDGFIFLFVNKIIASYPGAFLILTIVFPIILFLSIKKLRSNIIVFLLYGLFPYLELLSKILV